MLRTHKSVRDTEVGWGAGGDGVVSIATLYILDGLGGSNPDVARHLPRPTLGPSQPPVRFVQGLLPVCNAAGALC